MGHFEFNERLLWIQKTQAIFSVVCCLRQNLAKIKHGLFKELHKPKTRFHTSLRPAGLNRHGTTLSKSEGLFSELLDELVEWECPVFSSFSVGVV